MLDLEYFHFVQINQHEYTERLKYDDNQRHYIMLWRRSEKYNVSPLVKSHSIALKDDYTDDKVYRANYWTRLLVLFKTCCIYQTIK